MSTPESNWDRLFEGLQNSRQRIAIVVTGGGAGALARCFRREGASKNFVEAVIPYSHAALIEYLGSPPSDSSASPAVAKQLAAVALRRAAGMGDADHQNENHVREAAGIALSAALPTTPRRRGTDRIHVVLRTHRRGVLWSLELTKDAQTRERAETIADEMVYRALTELTEYPPNERFFEDAGLNLQQASFDV